MPSDTLWLEDLDWCEDLASVRNSCDRFDPGVADSILGHLPST